MAGFEVIIYGRFWVITEAIAAGSKHSCTKLFLAKFHEINKRDWASSQSTKSDSNEPSRHCLTSRRCLNECHSTVNSYRMP